jgi:hypothetical protein
MGCTVFDDLGFHSFPIFLEATSLLCTVLPTHSPYIPPTLNTVADVQGWNHATSPVCCDQLYCMHLFSRAVDHCKSFGEVNNCQ